MANTWSSSIELSQPSNSALSADLSSDENQRRIARIEVRERQAAQLFLDLGTRADPETRNLLLDFGSKIEALCSLARDPGGFSLMSFNAKRSELRVELDERAARAAILLPQLPDARRLSTLDFEAAQKDREAAEREREAAESAKVEAAKLESNCAASREWLLLHGSELMAAKAKANSRNCGELEATADGLKALAPPAPLLQFVETFAASFSEAGIACRAGESSKARDFLRGPPMEVLENFASWCRSEE